MGKRWCCAPVLCPPPTTLLFFFPWGRQPCLQSLQAVCLRLAGFCVSVFGKPPAPLLPACSVWVCVAEGRHWLVSLLSRALPWPCLSVCLPVCFSLPTCLSVPLCHLAAAVLWASWCLSCFKMTLLLGSWQISSHTLHY